MDCRWAGMGAGILVLKLLPTSKQEIVKTWSKPVVVKSREIKNEDGFERELSYRLVKSQW